MSTVTVAKLEPVHVLTSGDAMKLVTRANTLATLLSSIPELTSSLEKAVKIDFENKLTTAEVHFSLFGDVTKVTDEEFGTWPEVGSIEGHVSHNRSYDRYTYKDADGKKRDASFWRNVAQRHPVGLAFINEKKKLVDAGKDGVKNEYSDWAPHDRAARIGDLDTKFATFFGKLKMAVQLGHAMTKANTELAGVISVDFETKPVMEGNKPKMADGAVVTEIDMNSPRIVVISDLARKGVAVRMTIANFLRLNVDIAKAAGGTYGAFIKSNARETPQDDQSQVKVETIKVENSKDFENATIQTLNYMNGVKSDAKRMRELVAYYTAEGADDRIQTLMQLEDVLAVLTGIKAIKDRAEALAVGAEKKAA